MALFSLLPPVRDQGERETCLSIAATDGHHAMRGVPPALASDVLHYRASVIDGVGINEAISVASMMTALRDDGQPADFECPFSQDALPHDWEPPDPSGPVWCHLTEMYDSNAWKTILETLGAGQPAVVILKIDDSFWNPIDGLIENPSARILAYHAVLAISATASPSPARVLVRNSWGEEWGDAGYAWLSELYISARCALVITFGGDAS